MPVPTEFIGIARAFMNAAANEQARETKLFNKIARPVINRVLKYPNRKTRDGDLEALAAAWEILPSDYRLMFMKKLDARGRSGYITDVRIRIAKLSSPDWGEDMLEPCLLLTATVLEVPSKHSLIPACVTIANVSLHALARRYQRGIDSSHDAIIADLLHLVAYCKHMDLDKPADEFSAPVVSGTFHGIIRRISGDKYAYSPQLLARTFLDADA